MNPLIRIEAKTAAEVCQRFTLGADAAALLTPAQTPRQFVDALVAAEQWSDAVRFLANALPKREAVWWAVQCLRQVGLASPQGEGVLVATEEWVLDPKDEKRRTAYARAESQLETAAGWVGVAAFWAEGSMSPAGLPEVPAAPHLCAHAAASAIILAAVQMQPEKAPEKLAGFIAIGLEIAAGTRRWKER